LDITVICQSPKVGPHRESMVKNLAYLLGCDPGQVHVKGKSNEHVDAIGEGKAIACHVVALLQKA